ncbi:hypothetical protein GMRT_12054 [Giardia muris]|uniref:Coiled-coil protein n=1 Tax=Giardia muris TaxID=5742 RepID=A0A4Z1SPF7_GIAMU|nr:hypothetical protein GMRT_12054 [Giardia muris]|eukprot:TNJ27704.1 hypothetical protein GMRT_12054 [Giardia muris]
MDEPRTPESGPTSMSLSPESPGGAARGLLELVGAEEDGDAVGFGEPTTAPEMLATILGLQQEVGRQRATIAELRLAAPDEQAVRTITELSLQLDRARLRLADLEAAREESAALARLAESLDAELKQRDADLLRLAAVIQRLEEERDAALRRAENLADALAELPRKDRLIAALSEALAAAVETADAATATDTAAEGGAEEEEEDEEEEEEEAEAEEERNDESPPALSLEDLAGATDDKEGDGGLADELALFQENAGQLERALATLSERLEAGEVEAETADATALVEAVERLSDTSRSLRERLEAATRENALLRYQLLEAEARLDEDERLEEERQRERERLDEWEREGAALRASLAALQDENTGLRGAVERLTAESLDAPALRDENAALRGKLERTVGAFVALKAHLDETSASLLAKTQRIEAELLETRAELDDYRHAYAALARQAERLDGVEQANRRLRLLLAERRLPGAG